MDSEPYETRGHYRTFGGAPSQGGEIEHFTRESWIRRDLCAREPLPFKDAEFDFVVCSHTLEDLRDPLWVCSEMIRVGRRGYVETPSREWETCRGCESRRIAGLSHHHWLVEIDGNEITFLFKYHMIHSHWRFSFPPSHLRRMPEAKAFQWLFWEGSFGFKERLIHGVENQAAELEGYVRRVRPYRNGGCRWTPARAARPRSRAGSGAACGDACPDRPSPSARDPAAAGRMVPAPKP